MALQWNVSINGRSPGPGLARWFIVGNGALEVFATSEATAQQTIRTAGVWSNLYTRVTANDRTGAGTLVSRVNGGAGAQTVTIGAGVTGEFEDTSNSDSIAAGDEVAWQVTAGTGGTTCNFTLVSSNYAPSSNHMMRWVTNTGPVTALNGVTRYEPLTGTIGGDSTTTQTEANAQYSSRCDGTAQMLFVNVRTNTKGGNSFIRFRKNGANGNQVITVGSGVTGILEDTTNSDTVTSGDEINFSVDYFADANNLRLWTIATEFVATSPLAPMISSSGLAAALTVAASTTTYVASGSAVAASTTETDMRQEANLAQTLSYLSTFVISNTLVGNTLVRVRNNGADGNGLLTIGTAATGYFEDASNTDSFALGDEFNWSIVTPGVGTSIIMNNLAVLQDTAAVAGGASRHPYRLTLLGVH